MNSDGEIRHFHDAFSARRAGFNIPLSEQEANRLADVPNNQRVGLLHLNRRERRRQAALMRKASR